MPPRLRLPLLGLVAAARYGPVPAAGAAPHFPDLEEDPPESFPQSLIAMQFHEDPYADRDHLQMIVNGELGLAGISYGTTSFSHSSAGEGGGYGDDVRGEFCAYDASLNHENPSEYPTFLEIESASDHCAERRYSLPLRAVAEAVRASAGGGTVGTASASRSLPVSGLLFHEGHSGAGLVSNALATFPSARVVSEHPAIRDVLGACDVIKNRYRRDDCDPARRLRALEDAVTLLARTSAGDSAEVDKFYLRMDGASAARLREVRSLFPDAPWAFVHRDAGEALAKATQGRREVGCVKARRNPSAALSAKATEAGVQLEGLEPREVCALHLATLLDAAAAERDATGTGMLVSYKDIAGNVDSLVGVILPYFGLGGEIRVAVQAVADRVGEVLSLHSDTTSKWRPDDKKWAGEYVEVTDEVAAASNAYMSGSMDSIAKSHSGM